MESLISAIRTDGVVAFTGAGTSMPAMPSWKSLIDTLIQDARTQGLIDDAAANDLYEEKDQLYVIDEIYEAAGKSQSKIKVCEIFNSLSDPTDLHVAIISTPFKKFLTLNYDVGLEKAYASAFSEHRGGITTNNDHEVADWMASRAVSNKLPILHWHGIASDARSIVLSSSDYTKFYGEGSTNTGRLQTLFSQERCAMIGFGFTDPFIIQQLHTIMQPLATSSRHFAAIGVPDPSNFNCAFQRRRFASKYKLEVIFYPLSGDQGDNQHAALQDILEQLRTTLVVPTASGTSAQAATPVSLPPANDVPSFRTALFEIGGRRIYCEPNLWMENDGFGDDGTKERKITVAEIIAEPQHCIISAPHEFGLTNLGMRLAGDLRLLDFVVVQRNASEFPNYRKKLSQDADLADFDKIEKSAIIIDNYSSIDHKRLIREIISTFPKTRIIALQRVMPANDIFEDSLDDTNFKSIKLAGLSRTNIRSIIQTISPEWNSDVTSTAVEKVYTDLLQLCIPLTPSNVIIYSSVVCKDGSFVPVSRLHIVEKFVSEALQRASDVYSESFSYINKVDVFSEFCHRLFENSEIDFDLSQWVSFCVSYKKANLVEFDHIELLGDLSNGRIIARFDNRFHFKYRMFFSYFVGKRISSSQRLLEECLATDRHLELDGLVEVLCGTLPDCSDVLINITEKLRQSMNAFYDKYPLQGLDLHREAKWSFTEHEDTVWKAVNEAIEEGPTGAAELDQLKTSVMAERRTLDQKVSIIKFIVSEGTVAISAQQLRSAVESAKFARAEVKLSSTDAYISSVGLTYEVATIFAPLIAERKYVAWNGFAYINLIEDDKTDSSDEARGRMLSRVYAALPTSMASNSSENFGSRKLGQVFLTLFNDKNKQPIYRFIVLALLLRSKPTGWLEVAKDAVRMMKRDELYLKHYLSAALGQIKNEINSSTEVLHLKEFVAAIKLRRDRNVKSLSKPQIENALKQLDDRDFFKPST